MQVKLLFPVIFHLIYHLIDPLIPTKVVNTAAYTVLHDQPTHIWAFHQAWILKGEFSTNQMQHHC